MAVSPWAVGPWVDRLADRSDERVRRDPRSTGERPVESRVADPPGGVAARPGGRSRPRSASRFVGQASACHPRADGRLKPTLRVSNPRLVDLSGSRCTLRRAATRGFPLAHGLPGAGRPAGGAAPSGVLEGRSAGGAGGSRPRSARRRGVGDAGATGLGRARASPGGGRRSGWGRRGRAAGRPGPGWPARGRRAAAFSSWISRWRAWRSWARSVWFGLEEPLQAVDLGLERRRSGRRSGDTAGWRRSTWRRRPGPG